ncbi:hypothetical protein [Bradyrhizobium macuxiense]|uniref:hypothetical protein n=1 Tax=Bradyrhizobium macuxiense TaxID=1755647 RepID=UPI00142ECAD2|nr:hypothetical protein [Bradyrhizobium macuxiense]
MQGQFYLDDDVLWSEGLNDLSEYATDPEADLHIDLFVDPTAPAAAGDRLKASPSVP